MTNEYQDNLRRKGDFDVIIKNPQRSGKVMCDHGGHLVVHIWLLGRFSPKPCHSIRRHVAFPSIEINTEFKQWIVFA
jgi:hypothetical protein